MSDKIVVRILKIVLQLMSVAIAVLILLSLFGTDHGTRIDFRNGELYYTENVTAGNAQRLADLLDREFGDLTNEKAFQFDGDDDNHIVRMVLAQRDVLESHELDTSFEAIETLLQAEFTDKNLLLQLTDDSFAPIKTFDAAYEFVTQKAKPSTSLKGTNSTPPD